MGFKILFSNIGYARGIDGTLWQHISRVHRHLYCSVPLQQEVLTQLKGIIAGENPDLCCFVEIDQGSAQSAGLNQMSFLLDADYRFFDIADKYGPGNPMSRLPLHAGKSSGFMSRQELAFERLYFSSGSKRLIHRVTLPDGVSLLFSHFSLQRKVRVRQMEEMRKLVEGNGPAIILADFNIMHGFAELAPMLDGTGLKILNDENLPTFTLHRRSQALDLCLATGDIAPKLSLKIIPQPFSDHAALLVEGHD